MFDIGIPQSFGKAGGLVPYGYKVTEIAFLGSLYVRTLCG